MSTLTALATVVQKQSPDIVSGSARDREQRGRALAEKFVNGLGTIVVKFIGDLATEIVEVRQDFDVKPPNDLICGVKTFTEYCTAVLGYSLRHIDRVLEGHNPSLSETENADARVRKARRELDAKVKRNQNALPIRKKTNAEVLAEIRAEKAEAQKVDALQKQVTRLTNQLHTKPSTVSVAEQKDLTKIYTAEVKRLEDEIKKLNASLQKLTTAYKRMRADAVGLANAGIKVPNARALVGRAQTFLKRHGETVGSAS